MIGTTIGLEEATIEATMIKPLRDHLLPIVKQLLHARNHLIILGLVVSSL